MLAALIEYKDTQALRTIAAFMFGDSERWCDVAESINAGATPHQKLAAALRMAASDTLSLDYDEWKDVHDMVEGTLNNVRYDMGEAMGGGDSMFFRERPNEKRNALEGGEQEREKSNETTPISAVAVHPLVGRFPTRGEMHRQFQARMWREYAMAWDGRPTMTGVGREWVEGVLRISRPECLRRARAALASAAALRAAGCSGHSAATSAGGRHA